MMTISLVGGHEMAVDASNCFTRPSSGDNHVPPIPHNKCKGDKVGAIFFS